MATINPTPPLPASLRAQLPTMYDLPSEHPEDGMPDEFHVLPPQLLRETFLPANYPPQRCFVATDLYLYYGPAEYRLVQAPGLVCRARHLAPVRWP